MDIQQEFSHSIFCLFKAIDEFQVTSHQPLSNQLKGIRVKHNAEKYQGW